MILTITLLAALVMPLDDPISAGALLDATHVPPRGADAEALGRRIRAAYPKDVDLNITVSALQSMLSRLIRADITLSCSLACSRA